MVVAGLGLGQGEAHAAYALYAGQQLGPGQTLINGSYTLAMQTDGNLVIYYRGQAIWSPYLNTPGSRLEMQGDGNAVVYRPNNSVAWFTGTAGSGANQLVMQGDGNLVAYTAGMQSRWQSLTSLPGYAYGVLGKPNGLDHSWYFTANAGYEIYATWAMATLGWTKFNTRRVSSAGLADVVIRSAAISPSRYAEAACTGWLNNTVCDQFTVTINSGRSDGDREAILCHEFGHTVQLNESPGGDRNGNYLPVEKSCMRGSPDVHQYGVRALDQINAHY